MKPVGEYASVVLVDPSLSHLERAFTYRIPDGMQAEVGAVVRVPFRRRRRTGVVVATLASPDVETPLPVAARLGPGLSPEMVDLCRWVASRWLSTLGEALAAALPPRVASEEEPAGGAAAGPPAGPVPGPAPDAAFEWTRGYRGASGLVRAVRAGRGGGFLWRPAAGAERGDAIASLAAATLAGGRDLIVLLPDVRVGGATAGRITERLGPAVAWLGSDRSARERYRGWLALIRGAKRVAVGGRGAVFAPLRRVGLIVVDDEAHPSYKERRAPRFDARAVAAERARRSGAILLLVGTPPSMEARAAAGAGRLSLLVPPRIEERRARPPVTVIDLGREEDGHVPSARTLTHARRTLEAGRRVVIVLHRSGDEGRRIAERVRRALPARSPARLDARSQPDALARAAADADLIVASPVIAKDLTPPPAGLVAIVGADAALASPDFRAAEELFGTWWHLARWAPGGRMLIETAQPRHPAVRALTRWDPEVLWEAESARRRELGYPPFGVLVRVDAPAGTAARAASELTDAVAAAAPEAEVLGPLERGDRAVVLVRARRRDPLIDALRPLVAAWRAAGEPMRVEVDPREVLP